MYSVLWMYFVWSQKYNESARKLGLGIFIESVDGPLPGLGPWGLQMWSEVISRLSSEKPPFEALGSVNIVPNLI